MEENRYQWPPAQPSRDGYHTGKKELIFAGLAVVWSLLLCNSVYAGGFNLGFGLSVIGMILCGVGYLLCVEIGRAHV